MKNNDRSLTKIISRDLEKSEDELTPIPKKNVAQFSDVDLCKIKR